MYVLIYIDDMKSLSHYLTPQVCYWVRKDHKKENQMISSSSCCAHDYGCDYDYGYDYDWCLCSVHAHVHALFYVSSSSLYQQVRDCHPEQSHHCMQHSNLIHQSPVDGRRRMKKTK